MELGIGKGNKLTGKRGSLEGCIRTLLVIEKGSFPDETCQRCENLKECLKLEPEVQRKLAAEKTEAV